MELRNLRSLGRMTRITLATLLLSAVACVSSGRDFPAAPIPNLKPGHTNQAQVRKAFGEPWRTGLEDGQRTWTYGQYRYSLFGAARARDLKLKFDPSGVLTTYTYSSTERDLP
jgi:hypothetical protein